MIIDLPDTTTTAVSKRLVDLRDEGGAVALGRVLTLVIQTSEHDLEGAVDAANEASREHPCRIVAVVDSAPEADARLDAEIRVGGDAGASEVVVLRTSGALREHPDTLVMPLLLPDAPIVAWWSGTVPESPAEDLVGRMAHRRITDAVSCSDPLAALERLRANYQPGDTDLAWTRITLWRGLLASALDEPPYEPVTRVSVTGRPGHPSVDLLAAWLGLRLGCPATVERLEGSHGISHVELFRESGSVVIKRPDGRNATIEQPGKPARHLALPLRRRRECLSEELRRLDPDDVFGEVLTHGLSAVG
ncbi:glucose-6-phosphate dehydrogenase assembly protein OpcA [Paraoerskovia marina]|uniref:Glucose-6-phosphate dehydrogenase assembly protein OpcA n=1 Tax=Paraoerskovia marina TaxID=545619 RepID=A0A1H1T309_9CELL|nr:glucose-6-phosphate dehydrogenase assembly protein OpcA [Paraoerskovia marina]SDS54617.1 glucose-6-phosphate dehydrogenase assembly protein OpcA [Paraoerskovia marina]